MAPSPLEKQPAGYKSPDYWLVILGMDLAVLCVMWSRNQKPFGFFQFTHIINSPLCGSTPSPTPIGVFVVLA